MAACLKCHQYLVGREDRYCGLCGAPCARLEMENGGQITIAPQERGILHCKMRFRNAGQGDIAVNFARPEAGAPVRLAGERLSWQLRPFSGDHEIVVEIDIAAWPTAGPQVRTLSFQTDASGMQSGEIRVTRGGVQACQVGAERLNLGTLSLSPSTRGQGFAVEMANPGAVRQRCMLLPQRPDSPLLFSLAPDEDGWLSGYAVRHVRLHAQAAVGVLGEVRAVCEFLFVDEAGNNVSTATLNVQARVVRAAEPKSEAVSFGRMLPRQIVMQLLNVQNVGSEPFTLTAVTPDTPMVRVVTRLPLEVPGNGSRSIRLVFATHYEDGFAPADRELSGLIRLETTAEQREIHVQWSASVFVPDVDPDGVLALDFGTTNSCVAYHTTDHESGILARARAIELGQTPGARTIPSVITFLGSADVYVIGDEELARLSPDSSVDSIKRMIAGGPRMIAGEELTPVEMATRLIEQILLRACAKIGARPLRVAITVPAAFWGPKRELLEEACARAWHQPDARAAHRPATGQLHIITDQEERAVHVGVIDEPTAAAFYYLNRHPELYHEGGEKLLMVCDFGGGTFDVSVVAVRIAAGEAAAGREAPESEVTVIEPLLARGNAQLGGLDIDIGLLQGMCTKATETYRDFYAEPIAAYRERFVQLAHAEGLDVASYIRQRSVWLDTARRAKHELSQKEDTVFQVDRVESRVGRGLGAFERQLTRRELEGLVLTKFCSGVQRVISAALAALGKTPDDIAVVLITGQTSRIPAIRQRVRRLFTKSHVTDEAQDDLPLKESVAIGAAELYALRVMQSDASGYSLRELEKSSYRYGLLRPTGRGDYRFTELMPLNHPIGVETEPVTVTLHNELRHGELNLVQHAGLSNNVARDNDETQSIGKVQWEQDGQTRNQASITMRFAPEDGGHLEISVNGVRQKLTVPEEQEKSYL